MDIEEIMDIEECKRCNGSGEIARRTTYPLSYVGPGPVPEDARNVCGVTCDECLGMGYVETEE